MKIRFWGVRGSIPSPVSSEEIEAKITRALLGATEVNLNDPAAVQDYVASLPVHERGCWGGNTTCVEVTTAAGDTLIIDGGSGFRVLGDHLLGTAFGRGEGYAVMIFTHTHWDHIQGIPFFRPFFVPGNRFELYARHDGLRDRLEHQHDFRFFPVSMDVFAADISYHDVPAEGELVLFDGRMVVQSLALDHPSVAYAYRITADDRTFVMASDAEYKHLAGDYWQTYVDFYRNADVLAFDAQYTLREALVEKQNWGHSSAMIGIDLATESRVKRLVFVHHEPSYPDEKIKEIFDSSLRYLDRMPSVVRPQVLVGYEGLEIEP